MRSMEKSKIISCQISYFPMASTKNLEAVDQVLDLIADSGLEYNVDILSTTIRGEAEKIFSLISIIHQEMSEQNFKYTMNIMVSNVCGCE